MFEGPESAPWLQPQHKFAHIVLPAAVLCIFRDFRIMSLVRGVYPIVKFRSPRWVGRIKKNCAPPAWGSKFRGLRHPPCENTTSKMRFPCLGCLQLRNFDPHAGRDANFFLPPASVGIDISQLTTPSARERDFDHLNVKSIVSHWFRNEIGFLPLQNPIIGKQPDNLCTYLLATCNMQKVWGPSPGKARARHVSFRQ